MNPVFKDARKKYWNERQRAKIWRGEKIAKSVHLLVFSVSFGLGFMKIEPTMVHYAILQYAILVYMRRNLP